MALHLNPIASYGPMVKRQHGFRSYSRNCYLVLMQVTSHNTPCPINSSTGVYHGKLSSKRDIRWGRNLPFAGGNKYIVNATNEKEENETESGQTEDPSVTGSDSFGSAAPIMTADQNLQPQATARNPLGKNGKGGGSISSQTATYGIEVGDGPASNPITAQASSMVSSNASRTEYPSISGQAGSVTSGTSSLSAREKLRTARSLTGFAESGQLSKQLPGKDILDAMRESEKEGKTTKYGKPIVPSNLFDDQKRGLPEKGRIFDFSLGPNQLVIIGSFSLISSIMFGTAYIVWKVGAIHFNEY